MLHLFFGLLPPLFPAVAAYHMATRQVTYAKGDIPPNKTYLFLLLVHQWILLLAYWMLGMLVLYGVTLTLLLCLRRTNDDLFVVVLRGMLEPWTSSHIIAHAAIVVLPVAVVVVALSTLPTRKRVTRKFVEEDLRYLLLLMALTALVTFALWMLVPPQAKLSSYTLEQA